MANIVRRSLASLAPIAGPSTPPVSFQSITRTLPQAVRRRREEFPPHPSTSPSPLSDPSFLSGNRTPKVLPPKLEAEFQALRLQGQFKGDEASGRRAFLKGQITWRSRVRGIKSRKADHLLASSEDALDNELDANVEGGEGEVIGQRIYLPNIQIRLMRNHTPPGEAYDPHIATFRIPQSMTKTDLRGYLSAVYNLPVTFIRTDNYIAPTKRITGGQVVRLSGSTKTYKRAVVGLVEPFHYPDDVEELYAQGRQMGKGEEFGDKRKEWLEERFMLEQMKEYRKKALMKFYKGYRWRGKTHDNGGNTIREIMQKRKAKEEKIREKAAKLGADVVAA